ncbi:hypothetical protein VTJ83DRAFT_560 [Remersonia thermophila]|uniref:Ribosome maturation protein SDO1/SBDS N-terminal domain-containing protein n=1 Tax=Remersonia thermophila TaxID=72144 RepID=A0ABR4DM49_9PEZI
MRGEATHSRVIYKGTHDNFVVFVDDVPDFRKWQNDRSVPLSQIVSSFKVFTTHNGGSQGLLEGASRAVLENEFGTSNEDDVVQQILEKGNLQEFDMPERHGRKNDSKGSLAAH